MTQAVFFRPSYERLQQQIRTIAPELDIVLLEEDGGFTRNGEQVEGTALDPQWFWLHIELFMNKERREQYFQLMLSSPNAAWLHTINTGMDGLPYRDVFDKGLALSNNHSQSIAIAEYVLGHLLAHYQQVATLKRQQRAHEWKFLRFREIYQSNWLIIGFGAIGKDVAQRARAFGASVATVRRRQDGEGLADRVYQRQQLPQALTEADVVVLTCTANDDTRNMVDAGFLSAMKQGSVLINIARGDLVVEEDLKIALDAGTPELAILDVMRQEPPPDDSWLWEHPAVVISPHSSNAGQGMRARSEGLFLENLRRMMAGEALLNAVSERDF